MTKQLEFSALMPCASSELYRWHTMPRAIHRLIPPWEKVRVVKHPDGLKLDSDVHIKLDGLIDWKLQITEHEANSHFRDEQITGPFAHWSHTHSMQSINEKNSLLVEKINFKLPFVHSLLAGAFSKTKLEPGFNYRFRVMQNDIAIHQKYQAVGSLKILITGSSGLVGSALYDFLSSGGHQVTKLVRQQADEGEIYWQPSTGQINPDDLEGFDAVIHLAGENIANKRWTKSQKEKIKSSRVNGTRLLAQALCECKNPPKVFLTASAMGFYGDRGNELCDETSEAGEGFLAETCQEWEAAAKLVESKGIRAVQTRFSIILDPRGGALNKMLPIFKLGGGGILGNGKQWMSWIALDDVIAAIFHCIATETISGPVNFATPNPVTNKEFTKVIGQVLSRPTILPAPSFGLKLALGEMAEALLLASTKVMPGVLQDTGYDFIFPDLESALRHMLGK